METEVETWCPGLGVVAEAPSLLCHLPRLLLSVVAGVPRLLRRLPRLLLLVVVLALILRQHGVASLWLGDCGRDLGMESGDIPDEAISASSTYDDIVGPHNGRVRVEKKGGAWCPKGQLNARSREYLEVDLGRLHVVTATGTQGRFGNGNGREYTEAYMLEYWRPGLPDFRIYTTGYGNQTFPGNVNTYLEQKNVLSPPLTATKVRFIPVSPHPRTVCLRVEIYGCNTTGGLVSYSGMDGLVRNPGFLLGDDSYDGSRGPGLLQHGLGQLYDGELGTPLNNLQLHAYGRGKGWEWVGWSSEQLSGEPLQLAFTFDAMRNFTSLTLHLFSSPEDDFVLPTQAKVYFGEDAANFHEKPLKSTSSWPATSSSGSQNVTLKLRHRTGRVLKVLLYFPGPWLALSEVYFESEPCVCNLTDWADGEASTPAEHTAGRQRDDPPRDVSSVSAVQAHTRAYMGVVIGLVVGVFLLVGGGLLAYVRRLRKKKSSPVLKSSLSESASVALDLKSLRLGAGAGGGAYSGAGAAMYGPVAVPDEEGSLYHEPYKTPLFSASQYSVATIGRHLSDYSKEGAATPAHAGSTPGSGGILGGEYAVPILSTPPPPFNTNASTPFTTTPISAPPTPFSHATTPHSSTSTPFSSSAPPSNGFPSLMRLCPAPPPPPVPPPPEKYLTPPTVSKGVSVVGPCGLAQYRMEGMSTLKPRSPREIPRQALHFADKLGEGDFGTVHLGEAPAGGDPMDGTGTLKSSVGSMGSLNSVGTRQVVLAALKQDASPEVREDAWRQAQLLATLSDPNLASLVGVVSRDDPLVLVLEFLPLGDLNQYLRRHVPDTTTPRLNHMRPISYGSIIYMATQVASGMKYLEAHNITHRDLATRNVLVGPGQLVKISCVGSCRSLYAGDYYTSDTHYTSPLPIRWMSWESLFLGNFSSRGDVWAFGVTLWEMLTLGRQQPYERLSDEGVIENLAHFYHDDGEEMFLCQPALCPKEIYDLMSECWKRNEADRPNFRDIHVFLQRKNQGYTPEA
ncbi:discoidin domain-containing receptor 2-like isoform X2 [Panulirus ornatus]|uniref:discoidin domain-containing receptor 2-like isoform X2 n=1 Tax=Panulirus ornatus TaxID=150431 RepID=UPI003A8778FA